MPSSAVGNKPQAYDIDYRGGRNRAKAAARIDVKNVFYVFFIFVTFLRFLTFFFILQTFFIFKKMLAKFSAARRLPRSTFK